MSAGVNGYGIVAESLKTPNLPDYFTAHLFGLFIQTWWTNFNLQDWACMELYFPIIDKPKEKAENKTAPNTTTQ